MAGPQTTQLFPGLGVIDELAGDLKAKNAQSALQADLPAIQNAVKSGDYMTGFSLLAKHNPSILESPLAKMFAGNPEFEGQVARAKTPNIAVEGETDTVLVNPFQEGALGIGSAKAAGRKAQQAATEESRAFRKQEANDSFARQTYNSVTTSEPFKNLQMIKAKQAGLEDALSNPSAYGDLAVKFGFLKTIDPASVVRPSEMESLESAGALYQTALNILQKLESGATLQPAQRRDLLRITKHMGAVALEQYAEKTQPAIDQALRRGVAPTEIDPYYIDTKPIYDRRAGRAQAKPTAQMASTPTGEVETATQIERKDPKTGRIVIYDSVTKKPLRFKD